MSKSGPGEGNTAHRIYRGCSTISQFEVLQKLGEGTFGEVYKAKSIRTGSVVALKKILLHNEKDGFPITALREIKLLKVLSHPNVLKLEEMAVERFKGEGRKKATMYMVTPYMDHDLAGLLENPNVQFTEPQIKCYMLQLLEGLRYIHDNHILHRDMKAANLLINNYGILQIADFGLARHYDENVPQPGQGNGEAKRDYTTLVVTRWYRPPELLLQLRRYTPAIDMWGVGCVFGEMFKGKPILAGNSDINQAHIIFDLVGSPNEDNMPGWSSLPGCEGVKSFGNKPGNLAQVFREIRPSAVSLLSELLKLDWRRRINAIDALRHPYFREEPFPAKPESLPVFESSHELDRRNYRKKAAPPAAPAGGTVGRGPDGEWANNSAPGSGMIGPPPGLNGASYTNENARHVCRPSGPYAAGPAPPSRNSSFDRGPPPYDAPPPPIRHPLPPRVGPPPSGGSRRPPPHEGPPPRHADHSRPPAHQPLSYDSAADPAGRNPTGRYPSYPPLNGAPGERRPGGGAPKVDTYIPEYSSARVNDRPPPHILREDRDRERGDRDRSGYRDRDRERDGYGGLAGRRGSGGSRRTRSRSPERDKERERAETRDRLRDRERDIYGRR